MQQDDFANRFLPRKRFGKPFYRKQCSKTILQIVFCRGDGLENRFTESNAVRRFCKSFFAAETVWKTVLQKAMNNE